MHTIYTLDEVLDYLAQHKCRATYEAVGVVINEHARTVGNLLGSPTPRTAWVVLKRTGRPSPSGLVLPEGLIGSPIIKDGEELRRKLCEQ